MLCSVVVKSLTSTWLPLTQRHHTSVTALEWFFFLCILIVVSLRWHWDAAWWLEDVELTTADMSVINCSLYENKAACGSTQHTECLHYYSLSLKHRQHFIALYNDALISPCSFQDFTSCKVKSNPLHLSDVHFEFKVWWDFSTTYFICFYSCFSLVVCALCFHTVHLFFWDFYGHCFYEGAWEMSVAYGDTFVIGRPQCDPPTKLFAFAGIINLLHEITDRNIEAKHSIIS